MNTVDFTECVERCVSVRSYEHHSVSDVCVAITTAIQKIVEVVESVVQKEGKKNISSMHIKYAVSRLFTEKFAEGANDKGTMTIVRCDTWPNPTQTEDLTVRANLTISVDCVKMYISTLTPHKLETGALLFITGVCEYIVNNVEHVKYSSRSTESHFSKCKVVLWKGTKREKKCDKIHFKEGVCRKHYNTKHA